MADGQSNGVCLCCGAQTKRFIGRSAKFCVGRKCLDRYRARVSRGVAGCDLDVVCCECHKVFQGTATNGTRRRKFCSTACRYAHIKLAYKAKQVPGKCIKCGKETRGFSTGWAAKYCSKKCLPRKKKKERGPFICRCCGVSYMTRRPASTGEGEKYCSIKCYYSHKPERNRIKRQGRPTFREQAAAGIAQRKAERYALRLARALVVHPVRMSDCTLCGKTYVRQQYKHYCSDACRESAKERCKERWKTSASYKRSRRIHKAKRKAIERGVQAERIDPIDVFRRDKWRCKLCFVSTPRSLRGSYDDRAPELDHVIPLALGGVHAWHNVQCTCRKCNGLKGARSLGQLGLNLVDIPGDRLTGQGAVYAL